MGPHEPRSPAALAIRFAARASAVDMQDPEFFKQPFTRATREYAPSALEFESFNCSPVGVTGTITSAKR